MIKVLNLLNCDFSSMFMRNSWSVLIVINFALSKLLVDNIFFFDNIDRS